jgi:protein-S-isoprenylcysteine O-methyltransferase Ste14
MTETLNIVYTVAAFILLAAFYLAYVTKTLILTRQNIKADILGKGEKPKAGIALEVALKCVTYLGVAIQLAGVIWAGRSRSLPVFPAVREGGLFLMLLGVIAFISAIAAMKTNWRAGYAEGQDTELVTRGIYQYSRNPAFLGFDLLYIGCALAFPNTLNIAVALTAVVLFHFQILGEELFLAKTFGRKYAVYRVVTMRYWGRRKSK